MLYADRRAGEGPCSCEFVVRLDNDRAYTRVNARLYMARFAAVRCNDPVSDCRPFQLLALGCSLFGRTFPEVAGSIPARPMRFAGVSSKETTRASTKRRKRLRLDADFRCRLRLLAARFSLSRGFSVYIANIDGTLYPFGAKTATCSGRGAPERTSTRRQPWRAWRLTQESSGNRDLVACASAFRAGRRQ